MKGLIVKHAAIGDETVSSILKRETADLHRQAEHAPFQRALVKGELPRERYVAHLAQLLLIHRALEAHLRDLCAGRPEVARIVQDFQFQEPYLLDDLAFFGRDAAAIEAIRPLAQTRALIDEIEAAAASKPLAVLGMHYVLEGSNNGGRFIARAVRSAYALTPGQGDRYLDPYGEAQSLRWQAFKDELDAAGYGAEETGALLDGAKRMFEGVTRVGEGVLAQATLDGA